MSEPNGILTHDPKLAANLLGSFVRILQWTMGLIVVMVLVPTSDPSLPGIAVLSLGSPLLLLAATFLFRRLLKSGHTRLVSWLLLCCPYLAMLSGIWKHGPNAPETFLLLGSIPFAALLLGLRVGIGYALLQLGTLAAAFFLHPTAKSVLPLESSLESVAMVSMMVSMLVALYLEIPTQGLFSAIRISMNEQEELDEAIAGLESETRNLVHSVEVRTEGLREANQSLARLSASLSHDLRAPLRSISEFAKTLSEQELPESVAPQLQGIGTDVESLQLILEKTMQSLRRETGS